MLPLETDFLPMPMPPILFLPTHCKITSSHRKEELVLTGGLVSQPEGTISISTFLSRGSFAILCWDPAPTVGTAHLCPGSNWPLKPH